MATRFRKSPRITPERGNVSSIDRVSDLINQLEQEELEQEDSPIGPDIVQKESLTPQTTVLNSRDPDGLSLSGEVVGVVNEVNFPPESLQSLGVSTIVQDVTQSSLQGNVITHLPMPRKVGWADNEGEGGQQQQSRTPQPFQNSNSQVPPMGSSYRTPIGWANATGTGSTAPADSTGGGKDRKSKRKPANQQVPSLNLPDPNEEQDRKLPVNGTPRPDSSRSNPGRGRASRSQRASRSSGDSARLNSLAKNIKKGLEEENKRQLNTIASSLEQLLNIQRKQAEKICDIEQSRALKPSDSAPD